MATIDMFLGPLFLLMIVVFQRDVLKLLFAGRFSKVKKLEWFWLLINLFFGVVLTLRMIITVLS